MEGIQGFREAGVEGFEGSGKGFGGLGKDLLRRAATGGRAHHQGRLSRNTFGADGSG